MSDHVGGLDVEAIRRDFPILSRAMGDHPLVYLDSAATSQKPNQVIDAVSEFTRRHNANAHRGIYELGEEATEAYEGARATIAGLQSLKRPDEVARLRGLAPEEFVPKALWAAYKESRRGPHTPVAEGRVVSAALGPADSRR